VGLAPPLSALCSYRSAEHLAPPEREEDCHLAREGSPGRSLARDLGELQASPGLGAAGLDLSAGLNWTGGDTLQEDGSVLLQPPHLSPSRRGADSSHINFYDESKNPFDESNTTGGKGATPAKENHPNFSESAPGNGPVNPPEGDDKSFTTSPIHSTSLLSHFSSTSSSPPPLPPKARHLVHTGWGGQMSPIAPPSPLATTSPSALPTVLSRADNSPLSSPTEHYVILPTASLPTASLPTPSLPTASLPTASLPTATLPTSPSPLPSPTPVLSATNFSTPPVVLTAVRMVGSSASLHH